jgi:hypothetical protein
MKLNWLIAILAAVLLALGVRWLIYARTETASIACVSNLRRIAAAKQQWGLEQHKGADARPTWTDILPYMGPAQSGQIPHCPNGGVYTIGPLNQSPTCSIGGRDHTLSETP